MMMMMVRMMMTLMTVPCEAKLARKEDREKVRARRKMDRLIELAREYENTMNFKEWDTTETGTNRMYSVRFEPTCAKAVNGIKDLGSET